MTISELQAELIADGCNKNEQMIALIVAVLSEGPRSKSQIIGRLMALGYHRGAVAIQLKLNEGLKGYALWDRDPDEMYFLKL